MFKLKSASAQSTAFTTASTSSLLSSSAPSSSAATCSLCPLYKNILSLIIGLIIGIRFTDIWFNIQNETLTTILPTMTTTTSSSTYLSPLDGDDLFNATRVLCWVLTNPSNHLTKAIHIRNTWGGRCNKLLFMSTDDDEVLNSVKLDVEEGREHLWNKTRLALKHIHDHHINDAEWFLKADDDTYVIMENLRHFLYQYPPEAPVYFGAKFKQFVKQGYMSGGAGYVLSRESLIKFISQAYDNLDLCPETYEAEDVQLGLCMQNIGVIAGDSRDDHGNERFLPLPIDYLIPEDKTWWYKNYSFYPQKENTTCCSASAISFHYIKPEQFYILDYFLYTLRPYGVNNNLSNSYTNLPRKIQISEIMSNQLQTVQPIPEPPSDKR